MEKKKCSKCKKKKLLKEFSGDKYKKDKLSSQCRKCVSIRNKEAELKRQFGKLEYIPSHGPRNENVIYITGTCEICNESFGKRHASHARCTNCTNLIRKISSRVNTVRTTKVGKASPDSILEISKRFYWTNTCGYCARQFTEKNYKSIDHLIPISRGGLNDKDNIIISCIECNRAKAWQTLEEWIDLCKRVYETYKNKT